MTAGCDGLRVRVEGRAGWITLDRPDALNALTWDMCRAIDAALDAWRDDDRVALVMIDGTGRAFCAGGDIAVMHARARAGDHAYGRDFWREEYRLNAKLHRYPKPVVAFLHGYVMGGGVGVGCHASHRLVRDDSRVAMPECAIGLVPDVGGSMILARAPGRLGAFLGVTGHRMGPGDAILTGFADAYVPDGWDDLKARLAETGDVAVIAPASAPAAPLADWRAEVDALFAGADLADIAARAAEGSGPAAAATRGGLARGAPLSMACTLEILERLGPTPSLAEALAAEYRFTWRATERADFVEGIRALIVDKDRAPRWRHPGPDAVPAEAVAAMLAPLGADATLDLEDIP